MLYGEAANPESVRKSIPQGARIVRWSADSDISQRAIQLRKTLDEQPQIQSLRDMHASLDDIRKAAHHLVDRALGIEMVHQETEIDA